MAVTLTSTGITFSDSTTMNTAPSAGGLTSQVFNASGTWSHSGAGSPSSVLASVVGAGGTSHNTGTYRGAASTGKGGAAIAYPASVNGNVTVNVGSRSYTTSSTQGVAGGSSSFGGIITANGGGKNNSYYCCENVQATAGSDGSTSPSSVIGVTVGNTGIGSGNPTYGYGYRNNLLGGAAQVVVTW